MYITHQKIPFCLSGSCELCVFALCGTKFKTIINGYLHCGNSHIWRCSIFATCRYCSGSKQHPSFHLQSWKKANQNVTLLLYMQDHIDSWRKTALILTSVLFLAAAIWFIGKHTYLNSLTRESFLNPKSRTCFFCQGCS